MATQTPGLPGLPAGQAETVPRRRALVALLLGSVAAAGCVLPARSTAAYRGKAVATTTAAQTAVQTAVFEADLASRGRVTAAGASVTFSDAETDAEGAQAAFDSIQPPDSVSDSLRNRLDNILSDAVDALTTLRIVARRGDLDKLAAPAKSAREAARRLDDFQQDNE